MSLIRRLRERFRTPGHSEPGTLDEGSILGRLIDPAPDTVLVASDFHLGSGRRDGEGSWDDRENFLADGEARAWLEHHGEEAARGALLVLNGDIFDFIRIDRIPESKQDFRAWADRLQRLGEEERAARLAELTDAADEEWAWTRSLVVNKREEWFGLNAEEYKAVWKFHVMATGHRVLFDGLAGWVGAGGGILFTKGNHDVELYWPLVRSAVREEIARRIPVEEQEGAAVRIGFADRGVVLENLWIEHGHRYESTTAVLGAEVLEESPTELNLPLGSFLNRYFLNRLERFDPTIDNVEPSHEALLAMFRRHPLLMVISYPRAVRFAWRALKVRKPPSVARAIVTVWGVLLLPPAALLLFIAYLVWGRALFPYPWWGVAGAALLVAAAPLSIPYLTALYDRVRRDVAHEEPPDLLVEGARRVLARTFADLPRPPRVYGVLGHRHTPEVIELDIFGDGTRAWYTNAGTWMLLWPRDRPDLAGRARYTYLRFEKDEEGVYGHRLMVWDGETGEARPFSP
ncbi:MAG: hypothetical protein R6W82_01235 [bacterium]